MAADDAATVEVEIPDCVYKKAVRKSERGPGSVQDYVWEHLELELVYPD